MLYFTVPAAIGLMLLAVPLVDVFLGTGKFTAQAVLATGVTLSIFALTIPLESLQHVLARAFYAQHDTTTPVLITIIASLVNIGLSLYMVQWFSVVGLAIGFFGYSVTQVCLLTIMLNRKINFTNNNVFYTLAKILFASAKMVVIVILLKMFITNSFLLLVLGSLSGALIYVIITSLMKMPEFNNSIVLLNSIYARFKK